MHSLIKSANVKQFVAGTIDYNADLLVRCVAETTRYHVKKEMTPVLVRTIGEKLHVKANIATLVVANILGVEAPYMEIPPSDVNDTLTVERRSA